MRRDLPIEESMPEMKHALNSASKYSEDVIDRDCGAGAIARSREETILFTNNPLYELVWSQHEGPTLKYADSSLTEKKASHLLCTESFNMLFPSPEYTDHGETANTRNVAAQTLSSLQQKPNFEINNPQRVTLLDSPRRTPEMRSSSSLRLREADHGTSGRKELLNRKGKAVLDTEDYNQSVQKEVGMHPRNDRKSLNILNHGENKPDMSYEQSSMPGSDNYDATAESIPYNLKEIKGDQSRAEDPYESHIEAATDFFQGTGDRISISKEREDSYEIVESSNSKRPISTGKRALSSSSTSEASTKLKRQRNEDSCSGSFVKHSSPFMNWISALTSVNKRSDTNTFLASNPHLSPKAERSLSSPPMSKKNSKGLDNSCGSAGFKSFFQAMYRSNCREQKRRKDAPVHRAASEQHFHFSFPVACDEVQLAPCKLFPSVSNCHQLHNRVLMSSERHNQGTSQLEVLSPTKVSIPLDFALYQNTKGNIGKDCSSVEMGSPSCFTKIVSESPENKRFGVSASIPSSPSDMLTKQSSFLENLWIRRLLPQSSALRKITPQCNQRVETTDENLTNNCSMLNPHSTYSNKEQSISRDCQIPSTQGPRGAVEDSIKDTSIFLLDPCDSERKNDQKFNSNLNPIIPSERFEKSEHMASVFAKRLGAFRHIRPSAVSCNDTCPTNQCYFCGKTDHRIPKELEDTELEDLLRNMNSYNVSDESSSLCIRCFQLSHWASRWPHASCQKKRITNNASLVGDHRCNKINITIGSSSSSYDRRHALQTGGEQERHQECQMHHKRIGSVKDKSMVSPHVISVMENVKDPRMNNICLNPAKRLKRSSSSSQVNESQENQAIPNCQIEAIKGANYPTAIFERVKKLCLPRTDITRWMMSSISHFSLEGFFLRLKLGKLDSDLGKTGYHVACISGANCKGCLSASIGGFTYLVDSHSISNHGFVENELKAWWSATLKGGGKIPTVDELDKRLKDRMEFGF